jgi:exodeoxyribonuclease V alpha subunit
MFSNLQKFIIITPLDRQGEYSREALNAKIVAGIGQGKPCYAGLPVIMNANQVNLGLSNGERGVMIEEDGQFKVYFGAGRSFPLVLVKNWSVAYCITIHKSQGSEFNEVAILVPSYSGRVLSPKLIYTALTRAKNKIHLYKDSDEWALALQQQKIARNTPLLATFL